ncbi:hypothetical protein [Streptomyces sp. NPDC126503]|uniref:hypothetical protein n=1 Tax=Streptomyces sp. NPDC126503 TaxID=3155315 RepID=UPI0033278B18
MVPTPPRPPGGLIVPPGRGRALRTAAHQVTFKVTGEQPRRASTFEVVVPPGSDVGAHLHTRSEELMEILSTDRPTDGPTDHTAIAALRRRYDSEQLTPLRHDLPVRSR